MKINKLPFNKNALIVTVAVVLVAALGYGAYAATSKQWPFAAEAPAAETTASGTDTATADTTDTPSGVTPSSSGTPTESPKTPVDNEGPGDMPKNQVGVTLTSIIMSGDNVRVKSLIEAVTNEGTCTLTLTKDGKTVTKTSGIQALPNSSTCKGFTVPKSELSAGTWHVKLSVATGGKTGSATQDYKVQ